MKDNLTIDLNCDMGESFGAWIMGNDEAILPYVSSANIACGFHAGDPSTMMKTISLAMKYQVRIGAHPGFDDREGFGRREMKLSPKEVYDLLIYQIGALSACAKVQGTTLHHVKPHGALYNMAAKDSTLAEAIAEAVYAVDPSLVLYGLSGSALVQAGEAKGLRVYHEVFADRSYQADGTLTPRTVAGALITDTEVAVAQVLQLVKTGTVRSQQGADIPVKADTICLHGDNIAAVAFAKQINQVLAAEHISIR